MTLLNFNPTPDEYSKLSDRNRAEVLRWIQAVSEIMETFGLPERRRVIDKVALRLGVKRCVVRRKLTRWLSSGQQWQTFIDKRRS